MSTAVIFWTILGSVVGIGCIFVLIAYLVWRFYVHPRSKVDDSEAFFEEITETQIKTVTSHPPDGATVVTQNVRTRTRSSKPRDRRGSKAIEEINNQLASNRNNDDMSDGSVVVTTWNVPSLMNNWRESEEDFIKTMSKSNFSQLPWRAPFSKHSPRVSKTRLNNKPEDKMEIIELT